MSMYRVLNRQDLPLTYRHQQVLWWYVRWLSEKLDIMPRFWYDSLPFSINVAILTLATELAEGFNDQVTRNLLSNPPPSSDS